jgi:glutamine cyclotransferase
LLAVAGAVTAILLFPRNGGAAPPILRAELIQTFPHDDTAFCQGLVFRDGWLLEGTGQYSRSRLRAVEITSGRSAREVRLSNDVFGEGITVWKDTLLQLTWRNGFVITWNPDTLERTGSVPYAKIDKSLREGWGITHDGHSLIISDGTADLRFVNPDTWRLERTVKVRAAGRPLTKLNELEFVNGRILANVWYDDRIAIIDPESGNVERWLDVSHLRPDAVRGEKEFVLNGIAWDERGGRLFVTGKHWPALFEIKAP